MPRYNWNSVESVVKHHNPNPISTNSVRIYVLKQFDICMPIGRERDARYLIGLIIQCSLYNCRSVEKRCQKYDLKPYVLFDIQEGQELATPFE